MDTRNEAADCTSPEPGGLPGALLLVVAAAGLVWAIAQDGGSQSSRKLVEPSSQRETHRPGWPRVGWRAERP